MKQFKMRPPSGYTTLNDEPRLMIGMLGMQVEDHEVSHWIAEAGYYDKRRRGTHEGHWYSVEESTPSESEVPEEVHLNNGDLVCSNLSARDHLLNLAGHRLSLTASKHIIGVLNMGDETTPVNFQTLGYWMLLEQDEETAAVLMGSTGTRDNGKGIYLVGDSIDLGVRSSEAIEDNPGEKKQPGIRVQFARCVDAGTYAGCKAGDVVCYQADAGAVGLHMAGKSYVAVVKGAVMGTLTSEQFQEWVPAKPREVDTLS